MAVFVKTYLDVNRFTLWAEGVGENKRARLVMGFRDGQPRFVVNTGVMGRDGLINFPADVPTFVYLLSRLKEVANGENNTRYSIDSLTTLYENDKPTKTKKLVSTLYIGKSSAGVVYLSVIAENRPKIVFEITPSEYHTFKDKDNQPVPMDQISKIMANGLADFMLRMVSDGVMRQAVEMASESSGSGSAPAGAPVGSSAAPSFPSVSVLEDVPY